MFKFEDKNFEQAFPTSSVPNPSCKGLSVRDHYAGLAMIALINAATTNKLFAQYLQSINPDGNVAVAEAAFAHADAMLKERNKKNG